MRFALLCLVAASGLAYGQDEFDPGAFQDVFTGSSGRVFVIGHLNDVLGAAQPADVKVPLLPDAADLEGVPQIIVEGDGVLMPEERLDTVSP